MTRQASLLGVKRVFRKKRVALAVQVWVIVYAIENGYSPKTSTFIKNVPMQLLYSRIGFVRQPNWIQLEKVCYQK